MDEHGECEHTGGILEPAWCTMCIDGITPPAPAKVEKPKKKKQPVLNADPEMVLLMEYISGARCQFCDGLRTGTAKQCPHVRAAIARENLEAIEAWAEANPDNKGKLVQTAAASAYSRVNLRAAMRNAPSTIDGMSMGSLIGLAVRTSHGRSMEPAQVRTKSGDEIPV